MYLLPCVYLFCDIIIIKSPLQQSQDLKHFYIGMAQ